MLDPIEHRLNDIVPTAQAIVNIGKLMRMRKTIQRTEFGERLFKARNAAGKTQEDVRKALGISQSNLSSLEREYHSSTYTAQLAALYGVDPHYLATGIEDSNMRSTVEHPRVETAAGNLRSAIFTLASALKELEGMDREVCGRYLDSLVKNPEEAEGVATRLEAIIDAGARSGKPAAQGKRRATMSR